VKSKKKLFVVTFQLVIVLFH